MVYSKLRGKCSVPILKIPVWHYGIKLVGHNENIKIWNFIISEMQFYMSFSVPLRWLFKFWIVTAMHRNTLCMITRTSLHCLLTTPTKWTYDTGFHTSRLPFIIIFFYFFFPFSFPSPPALLLLLLFLPFCLSDGKNICNCSPKNCAAGLLVSVTSPITSEANVQGPQ